MPTITFIHPDDRGESIDAEIGDSAMRAALTHGIDEIVAECGACRSANLKGSVQNIFRATESSCGFGTSWDRYP